jgi:lipopolysaccharide/colanic/teichoic acid biosynthesis glycosyltransferase
MTISKPKAGRIEETAPGEGRRTEAAAPSGDSNLIIADELEYWQSGITISKQGWFYHATKRLVDIIFAVAFLLMGIPWLLVCGLLMKREAPGPFFYRQKRIGRHGKVLIVYKLRSMPVDAEEDGPQLTPLNGDKRCGPVGRFVRKAKIDELPQFWNVLKGEFSVVGPRPERPYFVERFSEEYPLYNIRHLVKPGLTGLAQINEKDSFQMKDKLRYDLFYVNKHSLSLDLKIIWDTALYCFRCLFTGFKEVATEDSCPID